MGTGIKPTDYNSHPCIPLKKHTNGVINGTQKRTALPIAELAAIFHDIGKINPYFQAKLRGENPNGYSGHAYLSAFAWFCFLESNQDLLKKILGSNRLNQKIAGVAAIIAHHHGNLPNLGSEGFFKKYGFEQFLSLFNQSPCLPISDYLQFLLKHQSFPCTMPLTQRIDLGKFSLQEKNIESPLDFFLDTRFAFASMIAADKIDASKYREDDDKTARFCKTYNPKLGRHLQTFKADSQLNKLRTAMRHEAVGKLRQFLTSDKRVFSLTAPTGAGKTLMLLSLAGAIIKQKNNYRIIYSLPYLSITEQVERECVKIFGESIQRIDSKAEDKELSSIIEQLDQKPELINELVSGQFAEKLFDYPFIITTFVRFFETLISHRNATLLKLPNFSKAIFLIDEIQSLPPRLYGFFVALLDEFCRKFDSYAIISTATMPNFEFPDKTPNNSPKPGKIFPDYQCPQELLSPKYFSKEPFQRYQIDRIDGHMELTELASEIHHIEVPTLVILNTIQDTKDLYRELKNHKKCILLNTHFTPQDRIKKIDNAKELLIEWEETKANPFILIATQLIEAGVDIDFPLIYRDMAPLPNIIQSAGRCNRNNSHKEKGTVRLVELVKNGVPRARWVYGQDNYSEFLNFPRRELENGQQENELLSLQGKFFTKTKNELLFGVYKSNGQKIDFLQAMKRGNFTDIGRFQLINKRTYGETHIYYIPSLNDEKFNKLTKKTKQVSSIPFRGFDARARVNAEIKMLLRKMSKRILEINIAPSDTPPVSEGECLGIKLLSSQDYTFEEGIMLGSQNQIL